MIQMQVRYTAWDLPKHVPRDRDQDTSSVLGIIPNQGQGSEICTWDKPTQSKSDSSRYAHRLQARSQCLAKGGPLPQGPMRLDGLSPLEAHVSSEAAVSHSHWLLASALLPHPPSLTALVNSWCRTVLLYYHES